MIRIMMTSATAILAAAAPAYAQDAPAANAAAQEGAAAPAEIIVTAQKRSERLQDVPLAVSVVSADALSASGKSGLENAVTLVPALNFQKSGSALNQSIFLRGIGTVTASIAGEPSVSTIIDGVVYSRAGEAFGDLADIDHMEVLRGPQGTLFGKNASAGAVNIVSAQPTTDVGGYAEASFFTKSEVRLRGAVNVPVTPELLTRTTAYFGSFNGNIYNEARDTMVNGYRHYGGRFQATYEPSSDLKLAFIADYHRNKDDCCADVIGTGPMNAAGQPISHAIFSVLPTPKGADTRRINQDLITSTRETGYGFSLQGDVALGAHTLTSITAYRYYKNTEIRDGDWLPQAYAGFNQLHDYGPQTGDTFSQELRLTSPTDQFVSYVLGAYYSHAHSERLFERSDVVCSSAAASATNVVPCGSPLASPSTTPFGSARFGSTFKNLSFFGQGTMNISSSFRFIGGLRYTSDDLDVFHSRTTALAGPGILPSFGPFEADTSNTNWSGKAALQYDFSRAVTGYASYTRGYKGPAYNIFFNLTETGTNAIDPETSDSYELGLKTTLFGGKLMLNIDAFYAKYNNFQANNPDLVAGVVITRFTNAGSVSTRGAEADIVWRPVSDLSINGGIAYTDAHVDKFFQPTPSTPVIPSGTPLQFAPKWKGSLSADYRWRTGGAIDVFLGAQGNYQSDQYGLFSVDPAIRRNSIIDGYAIVNLSAGIGDVDNKYRLTFQVRNMFDQSYIAAVNNGGPAGSYRYQIPRDADRYFGVTGRVNF